MNATKKEDKLQHSKKQARASLTGPLGCFHNLVSDSFTAFAADELFLEETACSGMLVTHRYSAIHLP